MSVNKRAVAQSFSRAACHYDQVAQVQKDVGRGLLSLLSRQQVNAQHGLDIGCGTGWLTLQLQPYCQAITALDIAPGMLAYAKSQDKTGIINQYVCADVERLPFHTPDYDLVFSSYALQWCDDLPAVFEKMVGILRPGGYLVFSLPVQNTLCELKNSWRAAESRHAHVNEFAEPDQVQRALLAAGFHIKQIEPRLDTTLYRSVRELTTELKTLGAHQVTANPTLTLTGKTTIANMINAYECYRNSDGSLPASWHSILVCAQMQ